MIALWIVLAVLAAVVVVGSATYLVGRSHRRGPAPEPSTRTRPTPTAPSRPPAGAPPGSDTEVAERPVVPPEPPAPEAGGAPPEVEVETEAEVAGPPPSFRERLGKARGVFSGLRAIRGRATVDAATWEELEEVLLRADVGVATTQTLLADLRRRVQAKEVAGGDGLLGALRADLLDLLEVEQRWDAATDAELAAAVHPIDGHPSGASAAGDRLVPPADDEIVAPVGRDLRFDGADDVVNVWLFVGVNGVGKTTTVGKLARQQAAAGRSVLLAAGDTFRAAAAEQLAMWADRSGAEIVRGAEGGDPSAIVFDAVQRAAARGNQLVLADTAGRLHTKVNLVEELKKIRRVADRPPGRVTEVLLVLDATTGQNGLVQARQFTEAVAVTGVVLTKLDGSAKGGVVIAVQRDLGLPVKLVGLGEGPDDLVPFDPEEFVDALLG
ncbi:MAG TPA: signal recognition particle-docking protein FtsY [Acidimicrobiales bacterium]|nr:signal recognition particle-docking protein FtsY [Acidimicrobiales bacterium]